MERGKGGRQRGKKERKRERRQAGRHARSLKTLGNDERRAVMYNSGKNTHIVICGQQSEGNIKVNCTSIGGRTLQSKEKTVKGSETHIIYSCALLLVC